MALQILLEGLESDRYLFNNPIWVDCTNLGVATKFLTATIYRIDEPTTSVSTRFYVIGGAEVSFDISEYIKGMCDYPRYPDGVVLNNQPIETNYYPFQINIQGLDVNGNLVSAVNVSKTFLRGGMENQDTNISIPDGTLLKESVKVPVWNGYEARVYRVVGTEIVMQDFIDPTLIENIPVKSCNPLFFRFINQLGGYSYWLFENWEVTKSTEKTQVIDRRVKDISTGHKTSYKLSVDSRIDRRYLKTIRALIQSPEVAVLGLSQKMDEVSNFSYQAYKWEQVWNVGNSTGINGLQKVNDVKLSFDYISTMKTETIW